MRGDVSGDERAYRLGGPYVNVAAWRQPHQKRFLDRGRPREQVARLAVLRVARRRHGDLLPADDRLVALCCELIGASDVQRGIGPADGGADGGGGGLDRGRKV